MISEGVATPGEEEEREPSYSISFLLGNGVALTIDIFTPYESLNTHIPDGVGQETLKGDGHREGASSSTIATNHTAILPALLSDITQKVTSTTTALLGVGSASKDAGLQGTIADGPNPSGSSGVGEQTQEEAEKSCFQVQTRVDVIRPLSFIRSLAHNIQQLRDSQVKSIRMS